MKIPRKLKRKLWKTFKNEEFDVINTEEEYQSIRQTALELRRELYVTLERIKKNECNFEAILFDLFENVAILNSYEEKTNMKDELRFSLDLD